MQLVKERLFGLLRRLVQPAVDHAVSEYYFDVYRRERLYRQEFFFNAFKALRFNGIAGDYAEFGVAGGRTFAMAYREARRVGHEAKLWAFDSFAGLPPPSDPSDEHPEWRPGALATELEEFHALCARNGIPRDAYHVVPGFYEETLSKMPASNEPTDIALAYVDCDLYTSAKTVLGFLEPRLKHGMIVGFDDYFCWSPSQLAGERRALLETLLAHDDWNWMPYMQFGWHGRAFVIEDKNLAPAPAPALAAHERKDYKLLTAAAAFYVLLPFDVIPDFIPIVGRFDDAIVVTVVLMGVRQEWLNAVRRLIGKVRRAVLQPRLV
jgi:O-methyltransferase